MKANKQNHSIKQDFIADLSRNKHHLIAAIILLILPFFLYSAIFFGGKQYVGNDVQQWRAAAQSIRQFKKQHNGKNPLWETNMFSGMPAYTISQPEPAPNIDTLINAISGNAYPLLYFWVLLFGVYIFLVILDFRPLAAVTGAIIMGLTTYLPIIVEAGHYNQFIAITFIPWILIGYGLLSRTDRRWAGAFVFALATALELRANHPQITYYFLYLLGFWWLFDSIVQYRRGQLKSWGFRTALMIGAGLVGILASLEGYLSLYQYSQYSTRAGSTLAASSGGGLSLHYAFRWSQGFGELLTLIIPGLFGGASGAGYWGPKPFTSGPHYLGAVAFVLALIGIIRYRKNIKYLFLGVGVLAMLFSLGYHFRLLNGFMFRYVPYFNKFRTPEMWLIITMFCFSVLAVMGIQALFEMVRDNNKSLRQLYVPLGIAFGLGVLFAVGYQSLFSFEKPHERQQYARQVARQNNISPSDPRVQQAVTNFLNNRVKPKRIKKARTDSIRFLVLVLLASALIVAFYKRKMSIGLFLAGLIILTAYDMISVDKRYVKKQDLVDSDLKTTHIIERRKRPIDSFLSRHVKSGQGYSYRVYPILSNPFNNAIPAYFYPTIGGYSGVKLSYYDDLIDQFLTNDNGGPTIKKSTLPVLNMLNVKYITYNRSLPAPGMKKVYDKNNNVVIENTNVLPKAFFVDSVATVSSPRGAVNTMKQPGFDPAKWAVVENEHHPETHPDSGGQVGVTSYQANKITLETRRSSPGFLVLSEIWYPAGWKASIDGQSTKIYKTNFVLRGLEVPAGHHTITLRFEPSTVYWGKVLSWMGLALLVCLAGGAGFVTYRRHNHKNIAET